MGFTRRNKPRRSQAPNLSPIDELTVPAPKPFPQSQPIPAGVQQKHVNNNAAAALALMKQMTPLTRPDDGVNTHTHTHGQTHTPKLTNQSTSTTSDPNTISARFSSSTPSLEDPHTRSPLLSEAQAQRARLEASQQRQKRSHDLVAARLRQQTEKKASWEAEKRARSDAAEAVLLMREAGVCAVPEARVAFLDAAARELREAAQSVEGKRREREMRGLREKERDDERRGLERYEAAVVEAKIMADEALGLIRAMERKRV